jgi:hypothetical protein
MFQYYSSSPSGDLKLVFQPIGFLYARIPVNYMFSIEVFERMRLVQTRNPANYMSPV